MCEKNVDWFHFPPPSPCLMLPKVRSILHAHASDLHTKYGISGLSVFGSEVRGEAREDSDIHPANRTS
jgi:hypothetical protein